MPRRKKPGAPGYFILRFARNGMSPKSIRLGELADLLTSVEQAVSGVMGVPSDEVVLSLIDVKDTSAAYAIASPSNKAMTAVRTWGGAITKSDFSEIPARAVEPSRRILSFVRRHNCIAELTEARRRKPLAEMTPDTIIEAGPAEPLIGRTVLYGYALRVGGTTPRLLLRVGDETIAVDVASEDLARSIGQRLYTWVGLDGTAKWDSTTRALLAFKVEELLPYAAGRLTDAVGDLSALIGDDLADVTERDLDRIRSMADS